MGVQNIQTLILRTLFDGGALPYARSLSRDEILTWVPISDEELDYNLKVLNEVGFVELDKKNGGTSLTIRLNAAGLFFVSAFGIGKD